MQQLKCHFSSLFFFGKCCVPASFQVKCVFLRRAAFDTRQVNNETTWVLLKLMFTIAQSASVVCVCVCVLWLVSRQFGLCRDEMGIVMRVLCDVCVCALLLPDHCLVFSRFPSTLFFHTGMACNIRYCYAISALPNLLTVWHFPGFEECVKCSRRFLQKQVASFSHFRLSPSNNTSATSISAYWLMRARAKYF